MRREVKWRSVVSIDNHPDNGQCNGGCMVGSLFARLACGHVKRVNKSRRIDLGASMRCPECENPKLRNVRYF